MFNIKTGIFTCVSHGIAINTGDAVEEDLIQNMGRFDGEGMR